MTVGGPELIQIPDCRCGAAVRQYEPERRTVLCWVNVEKGALKPFLELPSGGDTSYAGMVWHDGALWMSYYSSHEGRTSIYLAVVEI